MNENIDLTKILKDCPIGTEFYSPMLGDVKFYSLSQKDNTIDVTSKSNGEPWDINADGTIILCGVRSQEIMLYPSREQRDWAKFTAPWYKNERFDPKTLKPFDRVLIKNACGLWYCNIFSHYVEKDLAPYHCIICNANFCIPYNDDTKHLVGTTDEAPEYYRYWEEYKEKEPKNNVHFYVARNQDRKLFLYLGKPIRHATVFCGSVDEGVYIMTHNYFKNFGLNENDYKDLKWEDEPVEVFVNMED